MRSPITKRVRIKVKGRIGLNPQGRLIKRKDYWIYIYKRVGPKRSPNQHKQFCEKCGGKLRYRRLVTIKGKRVCWSCLPNKIK